MQDHKVCRLEGLAREERLRDAPGRLSGGNVGNMGCIKRPFSDSAQDRRSVCSAVGMPLQEATKCGLPDARQPPDTDRSKCLQMALCDRPPCLSHPVLGSATFTEAPIRKG